MGVDANLSASSERIAILGQESRTREAARRIIRRLGHEPVVLSGSGAGRDGPEPFKMLLLTGESDSLSSIALVREARALGGPEAPVLCVAAREQFDDLSALHRGPADQFVAKPPSFGELFGILRLFLGRLAADLPPLEREWGDYRFLMASNTVEFGGRRVQLRPDEFDLAIELFSNEGCTLGRDLLWSAVWARAWDGKSRMLDTCVSVLRRALKLASNGWELRAVWGSGYRLDNASAAERPSMLPSWAAPSPM